MHSQHPLFHTLTPSPLSPPSSPCPKIVESAVKGARWPPATPRHIGSVTVGRLVLPLYITACPYNLLRAPPRPWLAAAVAVWMAVQAAVLVAQQGRRGPR